MSFLIRGAKIRMEGLSENLGWRMAKIAARNRTVRSLFYNEALDANLIGGFAPKAFARIMGLPPLCFSGGRGADPPLALLREACWQEKYVISVKVTGTNPASIYDGSYAVEFRGVKGIFGRKKEDKMPVEDLKIGETIFAQVTFINKPGDKRSRFSSEIKFGVVLVGRDRQKAVEHVARLWKKDPREIGVLENLSDAEISAASRPGTKKPQRTRRGRRSPKEQYIHRIKVAAERGRYRGAAAALSEAADRYRDPDKIERLADLLKDRTQNEINGILWGLRRNNRLALAAEIKGELEKRKAN